MWSGCHPRHPGHSFRFIPLCSRSRNARVHRVWTDAVIRRDTELGRARLLCLKAWMVVSVRLFFRVRPLPAGDVLPASLLQSDGAKHYPLLKVISVYMRVLCAACSSLIVTSHLISS